MMISNRESGYKPLPIPVVRKSWNIFEISGSLIFKFWDTIEKLLRKVATYTISRSTFPSIELKSTIPDNTQHTTDETDVREELPSTFTSIKRRRTSPDNTQHTTDETDFRQEPPSITTSIKSRRTSPEYTQTELKQLLKRAEKFRPLISQTCEYFYRDEPESYFNDPTKVLNRVMKVHYKDQNGDPLSPINGRIKGLFFGVNVDFKTGKPYKPSIYGNRRLKVPWDYFWDERPNLYFSDFYCINAPHFVTLVMTIPGSKRDKFCKKKLVALDWYSNPFLFYDDEDDGLRVISNGLWVEVLYTEDVDIEDVRSYGGSLRSVDFRYVIRHGGRPKDTDCPICNIY